MIGTKLFSACGRMPSIRIYARSSSVSYLGLACFDGSQDMAGSLELTFYGGFRMTAAASATLATTAKIQTDGNQTVSPLKTRNVPFCGYHTTRTHSQLSPSPPW